MRSPLPLRSLLGAAALAALSACASGAPAVLTVGVAPGADAFACSSSKVTALGYTIESANKDVGTVRAAKRDGSGDSYFITTITATVFTEGGAQKLRVTSDLVNHSSDSRGDRTMPLGATKYTKADAQAVIDACGAKP